MTEDWAVSEGDSGSLLDSDPPPNGRQVEFEQLFRQHNRTLVNYVYRYVHSRRDAEDIAQEAYCRIFGLGDPSVLSHLNRYLYRTARNLAIDRLRERVRRETFLRKECVLEQALQAARQSPSPEQVWVAREEIEALTGAMVGLTPKVKAAFALVRQDGHSYEEAAIKLGVKPNSVRRLVARAMELLVDAVPREAGNSRARR
jgi:RNA polymerase sigma factor (sigma-70 family)